MNFKSAAPAFLPEKAGHCEDVRSRLPARKTRLRVISNGDRPDEENSLPAIAPAPDIGAVAEPGRSKKKVLMFAENLFERAEFDPQKHVEKILTRVDGGDVSVAAWEPGQISPFHCHPHATETYFCLQGGGTMKTLAGTVQIVPGSYVLHPPGELHEYENGSERTLLFRVRYGSSMISRHLMNRGRSGWKQSDEDRAYFTGIGVDPADMRAG